MEVGQLKGVAKRGSARRGDGLKVGLKAYRDSSPRPPGLVFKYCYGEWPKNGCPKGEVVSMRTDEPLFRTGVSK